MRAYLTAHSLGELKAQGERLIREAKFKQLQRGYAKLIACKVSDDSAGEKWRTEIPCRDCFAKIEPPARVRQIGDTGVYQCESCGRYNETYRREHA